MPPIKFELKSSWYLTILFLLLHAGAIAIIFWVIPQNLVKLLLMTLCIASLIYILRQQAMHLNAKSIVKFWQDSDHNWNLQQRNGQITLAKLRGDSICTLYFVLLNFNEDSKKFRRSVMIFPDAMNYNDFRHLRVCLKL